jgi:integrase
MQKQDLEENISKIEIQMASGDFWADKEKAQLVLKKYQDLKQQLAELAAIERGNCILNIFTGAGGDDAEDWTRMLLEMLAEPTRSLFLFHRSDGYRHSDKTRNLRRDLIIGATRAKLKEHLTWHDLRRTCGTRLIQDYKMPLHEVSIWLGHSDVKLTAKRYAFLGADALHDRLADAPKISATTLRLVKGKKDT